MKLSARTWPLPRRDPDEKSDPVELLVDITFVLALSQAASLMRVTPGLMGVLQALATLAIVVVLWQTFVTTATMATVTAGPMKLLQIAQTGVLLALAVTLPQAFAPLTGGFDGPVLFAVAAIGAALICAVQVMCVCWGHRHLRGNMVMLVIAYMLLAALVAGSVFMTGGTRIWMVFAGYLAFTLFDFPTALPVHAKFGFGMVDNWMVTGTRAFSERFAASYVVACCLSLELLEQVGQASQIAPAMLVMLIATLLMAYLLYRFYVPLVDPAGHALDPRNAAVTHNRKLVCEMGYFVGHLVMVCGLVIAAGALRTIFGGLADSPGGLGPGVETATVIELFGGIAACMLGQALFSYLTIWRPDPIRLAMPVVLLAAVPILSGRPALIVVLALTAVCAAGIVADRSRFVAATRVARRAAESASDGLPPRLRRRWRPAIRFNARGHEISGFELMFDILAAFTFAQTDLLIMQDQTAEGALRGLLVLAMLFGCWMTFVWAANTADADKGTIRTLHIAALVGLVCMGLALPRAFAEPGFNARVAVFLGAYVLLRMASAMALRIIQGRTASWRPQMIVLFSLATAVFIAVSTQLPQSARIPFWIAGLVCEGLAAYTFTRRWTVAAPGHVADRFAFIVVIGLDMALGGMAIQMQGHAVGAEQLLLLGLALVIATVLWWLYFDQLGRYAEHRLAVVSPVAERRAHNKLAYGYYNGMHLAVLAATITFAFGLRATARDLFTPHTGNLGTGLPAILAIAFGVGLAAYTLGITAMWAMLGRKPRPAAFIISAISLLSIPFLIGRPALQALTVFVALGLALLAAELWGRRARTERAALNRSLYAGPAVVDHHIDPPESTFAGFATADLPSESDRIGRSLDRGFALLDTNHDGVIAWNDFTNLLHRIDHDPSTAGTDLVYRAEVAYRHLWTALCEAMDVDNDHIITRGEYRAYMTAAAGRPDHDPPAIPTQVTKEVAGDNQILPLFSTLDHNVDGAITLAEVVETELSHLSRRHRLSSRAS